MKQANQVLKHPGEDKPREPEYVFSFRRMIDTRTGLHHTVLRVETLKEFVSFRYQLLFELEHAPHLLTVRIVGLDAPSMLMPQSGKASGLKVLDDLKGDYTVHVIDLDGTRNTFSFAFRGGKAALKRKPRHGFAVYDAALKMKEE